MGFSDFLTDAGLTLLDKWTTTRSYIDGHTPSQADIMCFKALEWEPALMKFPHAARWYKHIASYESEFSSLPGDTSQAYTSYGPDLNQLTINSAQPPEKHAAAADEDDVDLFGSDEEEDAEAERLKAERLEEYRKKKAAKPKVTAKSIVTLDVKPWDDETDMSSLEAAVRSIHKHGLVWGGSKLVAVGYGIKKLQINIVMEDEISLDELQDEIQAFEDYVQSTDVVAMQKL